MTKRNKTIAAAPPVFLQGRPVTGVDQHGNANTVHVHHTPPSKTQRYNLASSSSDDDAPYSQSGASEDNAGQKLSYQQASASIVNPMGYDVIDEAQPVIPVEAPTTYLQASAAFLNPMG